MSRVLLNQISNFEDRIYFPTEKQLFGGMVDENVVSEKRNLGSCIMQKLDTPDATVSVALLRNYSTSHLHFLVLCNTRVCSERKYWSVVRIGMGFLKPEVTTVYCRTRVITQLTEMILYSVFCITSILH